MPARASAGSSKDWPAFIRMMAKFLLSQLSSFHVPPMAAPKPTTLPAALNPTTQGFVPPLIMGAIASGTLRTE